jgi:hypothetical protein
MPEISILRREVASAMTFRSPVTTGDDPNMRREARRWTNTNWQNLETGERIEATPKMGWRTRG